MTINFRENNQPSESDSPGRRPLVSVVVLTYNNRAFLPACFAALAGQTWQPMELVLVDNNSSDDSANVARAEIERLDLAAREVRLPRNLGCAGGNNAGWLAASGEIVVFVNPDTELQPDCIEQMVRPLLDDPAIGVTGAKMYYPGGKVLQHAGGITHPNGMTNHHGAGCPDEGQWDTARDVDYVTGAALAIQRHLLAEVGGFDEDYYPAYYEEVDLCLRVRRAGRRVVYIPTAMLVHHESVSLGKEGDAIHRLFPRMRVRYLLKNLTVRQLVGWALPFEWRWMRHEPAARGYRWKQVRYGWLGNLGWIAWWLARGRKRRLAAQEQQR